MNKYKQEIVNAITYSKYLKFDKNHPWHQNLITLYCSLVEYSDSLVFLIEAKKNIGVPVIFRSFLEAYVDFKNLSEEKSYGYYMQASYAQQWLAITREASKNQNDFLAQISVDPNLHEQIVKQEEILLKLKQDGFNPLKNYKKFEKAGMIEEYRSIYNSVCSYSHNNIRALIDRFFIIDEAKKDFGIALFKEQEPGEYECYIITGTHYLRNASHNIHAILETGHEGIFPVNI